MTIRVHSGDLPPHIGFGSAVAIDTETLGLDVRRDRLCVVQLSSGDGSADVVQIAPGQERAPNLEKLLADASVLKLFHFGRFDMASLCHAFGIMPAPVYCTKIASKLARTYTDRHGLKDLTRELIGVDLSKQQQSSDWGASALTEAQLAYAVQTSCICTRSAQSLTQCWSANIAMGWPRPPLHTSPIACAWIWRDLPKWTSSRMRLPNRLKAAAVVH